MATVARLMKKLTQRQLEVMAVLYAYPHCNASLLADLLCVSKQCVHEHCSNIYHKLDARNRLDLLLWCKENDLGSVLQELLPEDVQKRAQARGLARRAF
ncbi:MAG: LuxR C-terminal-related transcriptional regulator [Bacillota bacterium]